MGLEAALIGGIVAAAGAVTSSVISSQAQKKNAKMQSQAQERINQQNLKAQAQAQSQAEQEANRANKQTVNTGAILDGIVNTGTTTDLTGGNAKPTLGSGASLGGNYEDLF